LKSSFRLFYCEHLLLINIFSIISLLSTKNLTRERGSERTGR